MKNLFLTFFAILLILTSCDNLKRKSEFSVDCNSNFKCLFIEKYVYPIGSQNVYIIDSFNKKYFCFDYDETAHFIYRYCNNDTIILVKYEHETVNDTIRRFTEIERVLFIPKNRELTKDTILLNYFEDTTRNAF
jgi:hypothetical protein